MRLVRIKRAIEISDTKVLPIGTIGRVVGTIVHMHSAQVDFGRGFGSHSISEADLEDVSIEEILQAESLAG